jgi:hypothetical protein
LNSIYSEPASLAFLLVTLGVSLHVLSAARPSTRLMLAYAAGALLFISAKPQNGPLGLLLAAWTVFLFWRWHDRRSRIRTLALAGLLAVFSIGYTARTPRELNDATLYNTVFYGILKVSPSPEQDLRMLGLDPNLAVLADTTYHDRDVPRDDPSFHQAFYSRVTYGRILQFYAARPDRLIQILRRGAALAPLLQPPGYGNFTADSGKPPRARSTRFAWWSRTRATLPRAPALPAAAFGIAVAGGIWRWRRGRDALARGAAGCFLLVTLMAAAQYVVKFVGAGFSDTIKHLFLFNVLVDLTVVGALVWIAARLLGVARRDHSAVNQEA